MRSTFLPALVLMAGRGLGLVVSFCVPIVLVRIFDQAEFGTYKQVFLIYGTLFGIAQLGMAESLYYFLPRNPREGGRYVLNSMVALTAAGAVCLVALATAGSPIAQWLGNSRLLPLLPFIGLYLLLMLASAGMEIAMISRGRCGWAAVSYACSDVLRVVLMMAPVLVRPDLTWLLLGVVSFALLRFCAALWYLRHEFDGDLATDAGLLKQQLAYAAPFQLYVLAHIAQETLPQFAVSYYFDAATFAIYAVGCLPIPLVDLVATSMGSVMMVRMGEEIREGHRNAVVSMWYDTTRKLALIFFPLVGMLLVTAHELITLLFTEAYLDSVPIFMIWSCVFLFAVIPMDGLLRVYAQNRFLLMLNLIRVLLIAVFIHWFLSDMKLIGAVLITVLATAVGKGLGLARMRGLWQVGLAKVLPWSTLGTIGTVATAAVLPALLVKWGLEVSTLPLLVATGLVYVASYLAMAFGFELVPRSERALLAGYLRRGSLGQSKVAREAQWKAVR